MAAFVTLAGLVTIALNPAHMVTMVPVAEKNAQILCMVSRLLLFDTTTSCFLTFLFQFLVLIGNKSCDPITGEILCRPGYIGLTCEHPCPAGRYGPGCTLKCRCEHGGECNHITGQCQCPPGWTGANCNESCPTDFYGSNCAQHCRCQNHRGCRKNDGLCICLPGWMGTHCDEGKSAFQLDNCILC